MEALWILAGLGVAATSYFILVFNRLVSRRNDCGNARGGIDANLAKRHDLVPNLVRAVRGYTEHEKEVLHLVAEARSRAATAIGTPASAAEETALVHALDVLSARVEAYPELQASANFMHLQRTLTELEEQISASRRALNAHVKAMNDLVHRFPTLIVARIMGFGPMPYFEATPEAQAHPGALATVPD